VHGLHLIFLMNYNNREVLDTDLAGYRYRYRISCGAGCRISGRISGASLDNTGTVANFVKSQRGEKINFIL
jgi:hypothetical protein